MSAKKKWSNFLLLLIAALLLPSIDAAHVISLDGQIAEAFEHRPETATTETKSHQTSADLDYQHPVDVQFQAVKAVPVVADQDGVSDVSASPDSRFRLSTRSPGKLLDILRHSSINSQLMGTDSETDLRQHQLASDGHLMRLAWRELDRLERRGGRRRKSIDYDNMELLAVNRREATESATAERFGAHTAVGAAWDAYERILRQKYDDLDHIGEYYPHYHAGRSKNPVRFVG